MMLNFLQQLARCNAPSGYEDRLANIIVDNIKNLPYAFDSMGNLMFHREGTGKRVMITAPMDEIGVISTFVEENGFIRVSPIGDVSPLALLYSKVRFSNGVHGIVCAEPLDDMSKLKYSDLYVDVGSGSAVGIGEPAAFYTHFSTIGEHLVSCKSIANRCCVYALVQLANATFDNDLDIHFVFTTQSFRGNRGAKTATYAVVPDVAVSLGYVASGDGQGSKGNAIKLGEGVAILVKDSRNVVSVAMREVLSNSSVQCGAKRQFSVNTDGFTDAAGVEIYGGGALCGALLLPVRNANTPIELVSLDDLNSMMQTLECFLLKVN